MAGNIFYNPIDDRSEDIDYEGSIDEESRAMKLDHNRLRKSTSEPPPECKALFERLKKCNRVQLLKELSKINTWTFGKCELGHWKEVLQIFDDILEEAAENDPNNMWALKVDVFDTSTKKLVLWILHFTTLLIEHSFSRHTYKSMDKLLALLCTSDMSVILGVLNLLYMFSKRSNFITRMPCELRGSLVSRLQCLAESWGGKENGFGLADCCNSEIPMPPSATTLHFEFHNDVFCPDKNCKEAKCFEQKNKTTMTYIHVEHVDQLRKTPAEIMKGLLAIYNIPIDKQMELLSHVRLAYHFSSYRNRLMCVQARLQALSVLVYANAIHDSAHTLLYNGLLEELVELIELKLPYLVEIRAAALRTLTSIIHLDRNPHFPKKPGSRLNNIIDVTGASQYHGFLPVLVRNCISSLTSQTYDVKSKKMVDTSSTSLETACPGADNSKLMDLIPDTGVNSQLLNDTKSKFPIPLATALFSFLYHLASYESGGDALVSCGMMESLLQVINWHGVELEHITFVTRAVRVIDLITNVDMQAFYTHGGLQSFINRLDVEVNLCISEHAFEFKTIVYDTDSEKASTSSSTENVEDDAETSGFEFHFNAENVGKTCLTQRTALLKSMLNFLKKALQDSTFSEHIRHLMEGTLPTSLKHIISNAEYYGPSLFLLATDVVTVYVFQEPSLLSTIQDNGLTDVVLQALLVKDVPATREVLASLPNVFSALCLNARGLNSFVKCKPFERIFKVLLSPVYLSAMRKRRSSDPLGDAASNLGNAMDELMRHQPSLKVDATAAIIKLLHELCQLGTDPKYICWRPHSKSEVSPIISPRSTTNTDGNSSDEDEDDEEEASTSSQTAQNETQEQPHQSEKQPIALTEYILNVTKFIDAILSNNSTNDHCREFVNQGGLVPLLKILGLPNLPVDCPITNSAQAVSSVCKSILNLAHESKVLEVGLAQLGDVLHRLKPLYLHLDVPGGSKLLHELANAPNLEEAFSTASATPLLHAMGAAHGYVLMFVHVCRTGQNEIRTLSLQHWGSDIGLSTLKGLADLYTSLVWESTLLLALCSDDVIPSDCDFGKEDMEKLNVPLTEAKEVVGGGDPGNMATTMEALLLLTTNPSTSSMDVETELSSNNKPTSQQLKYIKPLLGASSRLGRALAELFGLLVKLCVGSPIRQRRGANIISTPTTFNRYARSVAGALNMLLSNGLNYERLPPSPVPKFRLTFLICSVGFTSPMLFDEKRYPYHLMLQQFVDLHGLETFFRAFEWALSAGGTIKLDTALENPDLPEGTGEFLDAWLTLLEKMVNPKAILDSPHVITGKPVTPVGKFMAFNPLKYLMQIHQEAFDAVMLLWGRKPLPNYGVRMSESILTILRHILRGEKIIHERLNRTDDNKIEPSTSSLVSNFVPGVAPAGPSNTTESEISSESLNSLLEMGFHRDPAMEALIRTINLEQATEYLLSNPQNLRTQTQEDDDDEDQDEQYLVAIAMSLDNEERAKVPKKKVVPREIKPIAEKSINDFTYGALKVCLDLIETVPESIFKVCDLLVTIMKRNGPQFRESLLDKLLMEIFEISTTILQESPSVTTDICCESELSLRLGYYTHLYTLFFEVPSYFDMRGPCGIAIYRIKLVPHFIKLLCLAEDALTINKKATVPKWLTPILLLLDSLGKVAISSQRKRNMHLVTKRIWKWFDVVSGKWTKYTEANNKMINDAYWNGEQSIRIICGRRRYTISFATMQQINEESNNNRPICMMPLNFHRISEIQPPFDNIESLENEQVPLTEKEELRSVSIPEYTREESEDIVRSCVVLMKTEIDKDTLHAIMRLCLRLTQDFEIAKVFVREGGISCLFNIKEKYSFNGFRTLATLLIRHSLEGPDILSYAMDKVIRGRILGSLPPSKELMFLLRSIASSITRNPDLFFEVATNILKVDNMFRRASTPSANELDDRIQLKTDPSSRPIAPLMIEKESASVIRSLLNSLVRPIEVSLVLDQEFESNASTTNKNQNASSSTMCQRASDLLSSSASTNDILNLENQDELRVKITRTTSESNISNKLESDQAQRPILSKQSILKILADAVVSYAGVAGLITDHTYEASVLEDIEEDCTCLAFLFDRILPIDDSVSDRECSMMCRTLISGIASCNHSVEAQNVLVSEVKAALIRALLLPETSEKHTRLQHITGIILSMIEQCPPVQQVRTYKSQTFNTNVNNIARIMLRKGIFNDLARVPHCLDMSNPNFPVTVNSALKPMECLSKIYNQPITGNVAGNNTKKRERTLNLGDNAGGTGNASVDTTNAQGEEAPEDTENTDHDINAVNSSLDGSQIAANNVLDEIMDLNLNLNLLERGQNISGGGIMDIDDEANLVAYENERDATEELMSTDSGDSEDDVEEDDNDDNDVDEADNNHDDDDEDDNGDEDEEEELDNDEQEFGEDEFNNGSSLDRDEDIVMIQYGDHDSENDSLPRMVRWNENGFAIPIFDDPGSSNDQSVPAVHPLLVSRHNNDNSTSNVTRTQRQNRARRYQYLQLNARNTNPPVILQRVLGPHGPTTVALGTGSLFPHTPINVNRDSARVVVMDNYGLFPSVEEQIDFVDQTGYLFGPSMMASINHIPVVLHWWKEESRFIDGDSLLDVVTFVSNKLIPNLLKLRNIEIADNIKRIQAATRKFILKVEGKNEDSTEQNPENKESTEEAYNFENMLSSSTPITSEGSGSDTSFSNSQELRIQLSNTTWPGPEQYGPQNRETTRTSHEAFDDFTTAFEELVNFNPLSTIYSSTTPVGNSPPPLESISENRTEQNEASSESLFEETTMIIPNININSDTPQPAGQDPPQHFEENPSDFRVPAVVIEPSASTSTSNPTATTSTTGVGPSDDVPEGVDPSFLEALPPEMRREVLEQHRLLRLQQRISLTTSDPVAAGTSSEVSPEFLAALPLSLQEEVLTQQRLEQQRQAAARANPDEPVDAASFFETLQPSLRTMILSDMEDSQMSVLPPDLAAEAQTLRRDWEARNRQMVQERFLEANLTTIIRHTTRSRLGGARFNTAHFVPQWAQRPTFASSSQTNNVRIRGRQLLDHEALSCLLVLLFIDDPRLNTIRLHRVFRNLCYHFPTRDWVVRALLSIIDRSVHVKPDDSTNKPKRIPKPGPLSSKLTTDAKNMGNGANWLNIRMEAALGCHANVFIVNRAPGKRTEKNSSNSSVTIHHQAAPIVCRNALDLFISLARCFPIYLLPLKPKEKNKTGATIKCKIENTDFWDLLLKLDAASAKKGKSLNKSHSNNLNTVANDSENVTQIFELSAFGQLIKMLSSNVIRGSVQLTDKLLRLLAVISMGMPEINKTELNSKSFGQSYDTICAPEAVLNLAVNVLTYKSCSEEGLEEVTSLLLNLSSCSLDMSRTILNLLLNGAKRIGEIVQDQIQSMMNELQNTHKNQRLKTQEDPGPSTSKGVLSNRFTNEHIVITASTKVKTTCDLQLPSMVPLTSKSSSQVFFLRVLRVIVQIRDAIVKREADNDDTIFNLMQLSDQLDELDSLWNTLSQCLLELEHTPDHHAVLVLQPAVEAFFLVHSPQPDSATNDTSKSLNESNDRDDTITISQASVTSDMQSNDSSGRVSVPPDQLKFLSFAEKHRTVLNQILRQTTSHLADGPFSVLVDHTRVLDFDIKRRYFRTELERLDQNLRREETAVHVRREHVFEDSFRELYRRTPEEWKNRFYIVFEDEEGQDAGGLLREWYVIISRDIFNPMYALFTVSPGDRVTYMINSASHYNPNHLCYYKFVGRVIAKAIYDNKLLECYFTRSFYKHILGIPVKYTDMESEDYSFYRGLVYLMENNINNFDCDLSFSTEINEFGVTETRDLIPNGRNVAVTEENKMEYVRRSCQMKMTGAIRQQLTAFLEGFYDIIPKRLISIFNEQELELLISGLPNVDIEDLKANSEYHKYQANSLQIQWFWRALRSFDQADRAKFLQFVTGTSKVPLQGFGALEGMNGVQKFQIHRDDRSTDRLPSAHTCFNQLDLPVYETYDKLRSYLLKAIHECSEGFGFA